MAIQLSFLDEAFSQRDPSYMMDSQAVRELQYSEGSEPCFRTGKAAGCEEPCLWREACRQPVAEWRRFR